MADDLPARVGKAIDEMRPYLQRSGAELRLIGVEDGIAHVYADYGRRGHLLSNLSFVAGIERALMDQVPGLRGIAPVNLPPFSGMGWDKVAFSESLVDEPPALDRDKN